MNLKRILTSIIGLPFIIVAFLFGNEYLIGGIILITSLICMYEYFSVIKKVCKPIQGIGYLSCILIIGATFLKQSLFFRTLPFFIPIILLLLFLKVILTNMETDFKDLAYTLLGIIYINYFLMFIELIRRLENGKILLMYLFIIAWATDVFAYIVGKHFGKKNFSKISPKKTLEGSVAGIIGAVIFTLIYTSIVSKFYNIEYSYITFAIIGGALSLISQIGDFAASIIKRFADTKDYGKLLPGHGGMLDRIDSVLFIAPFAYMIFITFI